jgi:hypothetical protein
MWFLRKNLGVLLAFLENASYFRRCQLLFGATIRYPLNSFPYTMVSNKTHNKFLEKNKMPHQKSMCIFFSENRSN